MPLICCFVTVLKWTAKSHFGDMVNLTEMAGSMVGVYNGKTFHWVGINSEMLGHYLGEFTITDKYVQLYGRSVIGATHCSGFSF